ncbi:MAG: dehydrogenase [Rubrivivax sp.]|nr:dehydrogenase [Rubrivivax sp.]
MSYLLLILEPPGQREARSPAEGEAVYAQMQAFAAGLQARGVLQSVNALKLARTRVTRRGAELQALDGPFTETKELIGGYFLLDGVTCEQALAIAADCPAAAYATVEVRETGTCYE